MSFEAAGPDDEVMQWFELDDFDEDRSTEADQMFLELLRERAVADGWRIGPEASWAHITLFDGIHELWVGLSLDDDRARLLLMSFGVAFDGSRVIGDRVHDQTHDFEEPTPARFQDEGSVAYLAAATARWFESILDQPIEHRRWYTSGQLIYEEWVSASTGEVIHCHPGRDNRPSVPPRRVTLVRGTVPSASRDPGFRTS
jgi:hypothetical protein